MKVLHVLASIGPLRGGPSFVLRKLTADLAERGVETHIATTDDNGAGRLQAPLGAPVVENGVTYWYFRRQTRLYQFSLPMTKWLWRNSSSYDLIHIHAVFTYPSTVAGWIARVKGIPYIVRPLGILNRWGMQNRRRLFKRLSFWAIERGILAHASLIHYTSEQERVEAEIAGARAPSMIVANPVDFDPSDRPRHAGKFRARHPMLKDRPLIAFLSRIAPKKGLDLLIPAFARVRQRLPDAVLAIAGSGDAQLVEAVKKNIAETGLTDHVLWAGFLDRDRKADLLADADLFVLPSYSENFGVAAVEALYFRTPVIVSDQVGIHNEISRHHAGLVAPCEVSALADAMIEVLSQPELRSTMSANAGELAAGQFSRGRIIDALIANYRAVLGAAVI